MITRSWSPSLNWETPAGKVLRRLADSLPSDRPFVITVFGSAPLQLRVDHTLLSGDVDLFADAADLSALVASLGLDRGEEPYLQVGSELKFRSSPRWRGRTTRVSRAAVTFEIPHEIDILIAKLNRLESKDVEAFQRVLAITGHPTEEELIEELQIAVDLFRPGFAEEQAGDLVENCRRLWPVLFHREIDPRAEIIAPALEKRRAGYGHDLPGTDYLRELREAARDCGADS